MENKKIKDFTDLSAWQKGHEVVLEIYLVTKGFPKEELFGLTNQMRRSAVSITSNIAEGFSRPSYKDKAHFYAMALGSLTELQNQLIIAKDIGLLEEKEYQNIIENTITGNKIINGLIKASKNISNA